MKLDFFEFSGDFTRWLKLEKVYTFTVGIMTDVSLYTTVTTANTVTKLIQCLLGNEEAIKLRNKLVF